MTAALRIPRNIPSAMEIVQYSKNDPLQASHVLSVTQFQEMYSSDTCVGIGMWNGLIGNCKYDCLQVLVLRGDREIHAKMLYATSAILQRFKTVPSDVGKLPAYCTFERIEMRAKAGKKSSNTQYYWALHTQPIPLKDSTVWRQHWVENRVDMGGVTHWGDLKDMQIFDVQV